MTVRQILIGLAALLGVPENTWEMKTGHDKDGSFIVVRMQGLTKGHVRRLHSLVEDVLSEELGAGERQ